MPEHEDTSPGPDGGASDGGRSGREGPSGEGDARPGRDEGGAPAVRRVLRRIAIGLASLIAAIFVLSMIFLLALQTNWGGVRFADFLITLANPFSEAWTEYDELRGNFITRLEMRNLRMNRLDTVYVDTLSRSPLEIRYVRKDSIRSPADFEAFDTLYVDTVQMAAIDTFRMRYNLLSLLRKEVHLRELTFSRPILRARQRPDSTWDLMTPFTRDTVAAGEAAFSFRIDELRISDGELFATYDPPDADSVLQVENFNVRARGVHIADLMNAHVDTLYARYSPPGHAYWTDLRAGGSLVENEMDLTGLELESPLSFLTASGRLRLPSDEEEEIRDVDFELQADPVALEDLQPFFPSLRSGRNATLHVAVGGSSRLMDVDASGHLSDGGSFSLSGTASPSGAGPLKYRATGHIRNFDPSFFTGEGAASTLLSADFDVDLSGADPGDLDGHVTAQLSRSRLGGTDLASGRVRADFAAGEADVELSSTWNGSTITAEGTMRPFDDMPSYRLSGRTTDFNLASLGIGEHQSDLDATFRAEGYGFDPEIAEIDAQLQIDRSSINDYVLSSGTLQFQLAGGRMAYGLRFLFPDGLLVANGNAEFGDPLTFSVDRGRFENVDLAALLGEQEESSLTGQFSLEGTGSDPRTMRLTARLDVAPSTYADVRLQEGRIRASMNGGVLDLTAGADMAQAGRVDLAAVVRPFDELPTLRITRGEFANLDVGAFSDEEGASTNLNGTASFTVLGFDPKSMRLDGTLSLTGSRINEQAVNSAAVNLRLSRGTLAFDGTVDVPEGSAGLAGTAQPFLAVPTYDVSQGSFRNINLAPFTGNPALESSLDGTLSIRGRGFDPETMFVQGRVELEGSRINEQQIDAASVEGVLEDGAFDVELALSVPEGDTRLTGTVRPFLETPTYAIEEGTFAGINVGALTGNPDWQTNLTGSIDLTGQGFDPRTLQAVGTVELAESQINDVALRRGTVTGSVEAGLTDVRADLAFADGSARVRARGRLFDAVPTYALDGTLADVQLGRLLAADTLAARVSGRFDLQGEGTDPRTMHLSGEISSGDAHYEGADVDTLFAQFNLRDGIVQVDTLLLRSTAADARGGGRIALYDTAATSDFLFTADVKDLRPVRSFIAAETLQLEEGRFEGRVYGPPGTLRFDATGVFTNLRYNDVRLGEFEGTLAGEFQPDAGVTIAEVRGNLQSLSLPRLLVESANVDVTYSPDRILFDGTLTIDQGRTGEFAGFVETAPEARRIVLETLSLDLEGDEWQLLQRATIAYGERYRISNLLLYSEDQQLAVDGVVDPGGQQNLIVTIESVELDAFADLLGYEGLGGPISGSLVLTGPADAPNLAGTLAADLSSDDRDVGDLRLALDYADLRLNLEALLTHVDGSTLRADGYLPMDLRIAQLQSGDVGEDLSQGEADLAITADSFAVDWIEPFLDPETVDAFDGRLTADVHVGGTMTAPVLDGSARFTEGRIGLPELGVNYRGVQADLSLERNAVQITGLVIRSGNGRIRGDGTINLAELTLGEFDIDLDASEFLAIESREYRFVVDGAMRLSGTTRRPVLEGDVEVISGEILLTDETTSPELEQVHLSDRDMQTVERRFGIRVTEADTTTFNLYEALAMDLDVRIERNTWVRSRINPIMDIQFSGNLDLMKDHYQDVNMFGTIEVVPQRSRIVQFGKRFDITSGTLTFQGPAGDPLIDVEAVYDVRRFGERDPNVSITLSVEGRMSEQLDLTLGSDPQMAYTDIVSYMATGYPASSTLQLGGSGGRALLGAGQTIALDQLTAIMEGIAEAGLGLDVVTLDQEAGQTRLTGGTYVTRRLFVSVSQPLNDPVGQTGQQAALMNRPIITVEYEIQSWLLAQLTQRNEILQLNLNFEYAY